MKTKSYALILLFFFSFTTLVNSQQKNNYYIVDVGNKQKYLTVKYCFKNAPDYLYTPSVKAEKMINNIRFENNHLSKHITLTNGSIHLPSNQGGCVIYTVDSNNSSGRTNRLNRDKTNDMILEIDSWLWLPDDHGRSSPKKIIFNHKSGINVSAPWKLLSKSTTKTEFMMSFTPNSWVGIIAIGDFDIEDVIIDDRILHVALVSRGNEYNKKMTLDWIFQMASSVSSIADKFPINETQVIVVFNKKSNGAVPWGQVNRYGGAGVLLVVNPNSPKKTLFNDWTIAHEFSHLLMPYTPDDKWFSEGFASYYQNITRARVGLMDEKMAWKKLIAGFERGRKSASKRSAPKLKNANGKHLMQMYWGGAVVALKLEVALQLQSSGKQTLSDAVKSINNCCLDTRREWSAKRTFDKMDSLINTSVFSETYYHDVVSKKYPEYKKLLLQLGVSENSQGEIVLDDNAIYANIRKKIING